MSDLARNFHPLGGQDERSTSWSNGQIFAIFSIFAVIGVALAGAGSCFAQSTATNIQVTSAVQQSSVKRLGVNLGDQTYWDSGQLLKNLVFQKPVG
jgi:hypothetical protein